MVINDFFNGRLKFLFLNVPELMVRLFLMNDHTIENSGPVRRNQSGSQKNEERVKDMKTRPKYKFTIKAKKIGFSGTFQNE